MPEKGIAEFKVSKVFDRILGIEKIRFVQEEVIPPEVFIRILFIEPPVVEVIKIRNDGDVEYCIGKNWSILSKALIKMCALSNYRDLVRAGEVYYYFPGLRERVTSSKYYNLRYMPRNRYKPLIQPEELREEEDEYTAVERSPGYVTGHIRYIGPNFVASWQKEEEVRQNLGIELRQGYTYVNDYYRGEGKGNDVIIKKSFHDIEIEPKLHSRSIFFSVRSDKEMRNIIK